MILENITIYCDLVILQFLWCVTSYYVRFTRETPRLCSPTTFGRSGLRCVINCPTGHMCCTTRIWILNIATTSLRCGSSPRGERWAMSRRSPGAKQCITVRGIRSRPAQLRLTICTFQFPDWIPTLHTMNGHGKMVSTILESLHGLKWPNSSYPVVSASQTTKTCERIGITSNLITTAPYISLWPKHRASHARSCSLGTTSGSPSTQCR